MPRGADAAFGLERGVELAGELAKLRQGMSRDRVGHLACSVPRGARRQLAFSTSTVSFHPSCARWYSKLAPQMPPPTITTRARVGDSPEAAI